MKVSNYRFSCYYANFGQFYRDRQKFFSTTFIGYFCALPLCFCSIDTPNCIVFYLNCFSNSFQVYFSKSGYYKDFQKSVRR